MDQSDGVQPSDWADLASKLGSAIRKEIPDDAVGGFVPVPYQKHEFLRFAQLHLSMAYFQGISKFFETSEASFVDTLKFLYISPLNIP